MPLILEKDRRSVTIYDTNHFYMKFVACDHSKDPIKDTF